MERLNLNRNRRTKLTTRALPLLTLALLAFVAGIAVGNRPAAAVVAADEFVAAWAQQDFAQMHELLNDESGAALTSSDLEALYLDAQEVATVKTIAGGEPGEPVSRGDHETVAVPVTIVTVAFGTIEAPIEIPHRDGGILWTERLTFPGLRDGESIAADTELPERATILTRDGVALAEGPALERSSPLGSAAIDVTGLVGEPDEEQAERLESLGLPPNTPVGISGLERAYEGYLAGEPGGELIALDEASGNARVLARSVPQQSPPLETTIDSGLQVATVEALAGRAGGIATLDARNGAVRAMAGMAFSTPQPPGSIYKVLTTVAALERDLVSFEDEFESVTGTDVAGRHIRNAGGQSCGGTFPQTFARSCNSVFLPLGIELGADATVEIAERFGFNAPPALYSESVTAAVEPPASTVPTDITSTEELAVTAIGQGRLMATPLQMASVAQTVANRGVRSPTPIVRDRELGPSVRPVRAMSPRVAAQLSELMVGVVEDGTGYAAAVEGVEVAGKTGTAELGPKADQGDLGPDDEPEQMVNAWFIAFAPAGDPRLAVAVMLVDADADGGTVAAPTAAQVLAAGLSG